ncbi:MAG: hypothetical protein ACRDBY_05975 [Cetobacterium sp.]
MNIQDVLVNQIGPVAIAAVVGVLAVTIKAVGNVVIDLIEKKKEEVEQKLDLGKHNQEIQTAKEVWRIVDEKYRITDKVENLMKSKAADFDKLLKSKIPYLTDEEIQTLRQAIAGEVNKGKEKILSDDTIKNQLVVEQTEKAQLQAENQELKNKLEQIKAIG